MKPTLLILSSCSVLLFGACRPTAVTSKQALPLASPSATPNYSEAIRDAIAHNPPGDYNDALALGAIVRPASHPGSEEPPIDIMAAAIQQVRVELHTIDEEIQAGTGSKDARQQAIIQRDKLRAELQHLESMTDFHR